VTEPLSVDQVRELRELAGRIVSSPPGTWFASDTLALARGVAQLAAEWERQRTALTEAHSLRWLLGLDTHEDEEPQSREDSHRNLDKLLDTALAVSSSAPTTKETE
jgi:hypothetical protein